MGDTEASLFASNHFFFVRFFGSQLGDLHGQAFVYSVPVQDAQNTLSARIAADLKLRHPQTAVEQIPPDLEPESSAEKISFKVWEVKPYIPVVAESAEPVKKRMTMSHKAEDLVSSLDKLFNRVSINTFVEHKALRPNVLVFHQIEVPFTDLESKRIPVAKSFDRELPPLENACLLIVGYSLQLEQGCAAGSADLLRKELDRALFDENWSDSPRLICARMFASQKKDKSLDHLALLITQYLLFLKKTLIFHERMVGADLAEWQEKAWKAFQSLCVEIGQRIEGVADLNSLSYMSIRPKLLSGFLSKKGDRGLVKGWKKRYFLQRGKHLQYFKSDKELNSVQGSIDLSTVGNVEERVDPQLGPIIAVHSPGRVFLLAPAEADGATGLKFWVEGLRAWRSYLRYMRYDEEEAASAGLMSGNLWKKGVRGMRGKGLGWKQRYFTQIGDSLFYYSQSGLTALGRVDLTDVSWIYFPRPNPRLKFKLHTLSDDRIWTLRCETEAELEMWKAGVLKYCQNGPPVDSKLARESKDWADRASVDVEAPSLEKELHVFAPDHSVISEDSNSVILIPPSSGGLAPFPNSGLASSYRFVSVPCSKCSSVCCAARRNCSSCGAKLRSVQESETAFHTNRKMTKLPPLPAQAPSKSDRVAYQAFKDLTRRYREAGVDPEKIGVSKLSSISSSNIPKLGERSAAVVATSSTSVDSGVSVVSDDEKSDDDSVTLYGGGDGLSSSQNITSKKDVPKDGPKDVPPSSLVLKDNDTFISALRNAITHL